MLNKIPKDIEGFNKFITETDDCQHNIKDHYIYPLTAEGKNDYGSKDTKILKEPSWKIWSWTNDESLQWTMFRTTHVELYSAYNKANDTEKPSLLQSLNQNIASCTTYEREHKLIERFMFCNSTNYIDRETFGIQQDLLVYETPLREISILYEKQVPLSDFEKELIDKLVELHKEYKGVSQEDLDKIKELNDQLPVFWENIFESKVRFDKATSRLCLPAPVMEGSYSPVVSFYVPTAEELQSYVDDCNKYIGDFYKRNQKFNDQYNILYQKIYGKYEEDEDENDDNKPVTLYDEVYKMSQELFDRPGSSIDLCSLDDNFEEYKGIMYDDNKIIEKAWDEFAKKERIMSDMFDALAKFLNDRNSERNEQTNTPQNAQESENVSRNPEMDELRQETIQRYESNMDNVYLDADDWHIVLDNFEQKRDEKSKAIALKKALTLHPESETLLLRKASEEVNKHEYKKALEIVNKVEKLNEGHHPNFFTIKANILCKLHAPNEAIPLYNKLLAAQGIGMEWYHEHVRYFLIDIYDEQRNYAECIRLIKELLEIKPDDENLISKLSYYYRQNGMKDEAEKTALNYLEEHPESTESIEQLGHLYLENKDYKKALEMYDKSYELNKDENYGILYNKGNLLMELKRFDEAAVCFETCILHYHLDKEFHIAAAKCFTELDIPYVAEYHQRKLAELDPGFSVNLNKLEPSGN